MGRPASYDATAVEQAALEQFWAEGYKTSSVDLLVAGTGLNKHSLYQAFGGKSGLFARVLERYLTDYSHTFLAVFEQHRGYAALRKYLQTVLSSRNPRGCLLVNAAIELGESDPACHRLITDYYERLERCFAEAIAAGQQDGDIRLELAPRATASWLVSAMQGVAVGSRLGSKQPAAAKSLLAILACADRGETTRAAKKTARN
jgi:TetR/AcrR family transcriptional regulator, transcriptional repressor for nem operon